MPGEYVEVPEDTGLDQEAEAVWAEQARLLGSAAQQAAVRLGVPTDQARRGGEFDAPPSKGVLGSLVAAGKKEQQRRKKPNRRPNACPQCGSTNNRYVGSPLDGGPLQLKCRERGCKTVWDVSLPSPPAGPRLAPSGQLPTGGTYGIRQVGMNTKTPAELAELPDYKRFPK